MQLHHIFVGQPRAVEYNGKTISTGIFKDEVSGPVSVKFLNLEGDRQADLRVHGGVHKAVYAYPKEHYDFWNEKMPDIDFYPGLFGENLTLSGIDEQVSIGDEFTIGSAVFRVTSPRMPCFKLGIKMNNPAFIRDFMEAQRCGFYFQVLQEGTIEAGDEIKQTHQDAYGLTIHEVFRLYGPDRKNKALLQKAVGAPKLPFDWVSHFQQKLESLL